MERVLLLNATFEPLQLITQRRAVVMVFGERVEVIAARDDGSQFRSPTQSIPIPSIVRLTTYVKVPFRASQPPLSRKAVLLRDNHRCAYCQGHADTVDHVIPRSRGGLHDWANVVAACKRHNLQKGNRFLHELGWELPFQPKAPIGPLWRWRHLGDIDPRWEPFLGISAEAPAA
jgi:5-methylcytosine-specific restriction endonuclease McrA